jgi:hypothetical protein
MGSEVYESNDFGVVDCRPSYKYRDLDMPLYDIMPPPLVPCIVL